MWLVGGVRPQPHPHIHMLQMYITNDWWQLHGISRPPMPAGPAFLLTCVFYTCSVHGWSAQQNLHSVVSTQVSLYQSCLQTVFLSCHDKRKYLPYCSSLSHLWRSPQVAVPGHCSPLLNLSHVSLSLSARPMPSPILVSTALPPPRPPRPRPPRACAGDPPPPPPPPPALFSAFFSLDAS